MKNRLFNLRDAKGMVTSVCKGYVTNEEIQQEFINYDENKKFTGEDLKEIVKKLTEGKNKVKIKYPNKRINNFDKAEADMLK